MYLCDVLNFLAVLQLHVPYVKAKDATFALNFGVQSYLLYVSVLLELFITPTAAITSVLAAAIVDECVLLLA